MKIGLSIYSLYPAIQQNRLSLGGAIQAIAEMGAETIELVDFVCDVVGKPERLEEMKTALAKTGLEVSAYSIFADVLVGDAAACEAELQRIYKHIDLAGELGIKIMRSDMSAWGRPYEQAVSSCFERDLPRMAEACGKMCDYAAKYGITMTVENHGTFLNGGERIVRLVEQTNRENFGCTLDVGNCMCVDEAPHVFVKKVLPYAANVHFKDFYIRRNTEGFAVKDGGVNPGWIETYYGTWLRGSIVGQGDIDVVGMMREIRAGGYDKNISIEYEGIEDCLEASRVSLENVKRYRTL